MAGDRDVQSTVYLFLLSILTPVSEFLPQVRAEQYH